jgi:hypothetical protein
MIILNNEILSRKIFSPFCFGGKNKSESKSKSKKSSSRTGIKTDGTNGTRSRSKTSNDYSK